MLPTGDLQRASLMAGAGQRAEQQAARERDEKHRRQVEVKVVAALMALVDCDEKTAKNIMVAISAGKIPNVTLMY